MFLPVSISEESKETIEQIGDEDGHKLIHDCVSAIIVLSQDRTPIKKADLNKHLLRTTRVHRAVLNHASFELFKSFGFRLYELEDKARLLLVNSNVEFSKYANHSSSMCEELTVLYLILIDIFASPDERLTEAEIQNSLSALDLTSEAFGTYLFKYVRKLYLTEEKESTQQEIKLYSWGPRAIAEVEPDNFFKCFLRLVNEEGNMQTTINDWPEQQKRIEKLKSIPGRRIA